MKTLLQALLFILLSVRTFAGTSSGLESDFRHPPESARPWVYWYFMDGNLTREGMTADLEAMKRAGIGGVIFLEVNIGIARGPVLFMSPPWQDLIQHAISEADRLGMEFVLGTGPGWCGSGGPWVKPEQSMQHLVASSTNLTGPMHFEGALAQPPPRNPYFGVGTLTPELKKQWQEFYRDTVVVAFPTPSAEARLTLADEKALYYREPYSSKPGVKPFLAAPNMAAAVPAEACIPAGAVVDLTARLQPGGQLNWEVPAGKWTIMRFGRTITGQTTRPAPQPGLGFETDKFSREAIDSHFETFIGTLLKRASSHVHPDRGLTTVHFDSWEMSSQNWSGQFRAEFQRRRGYDPLPYLPAYLGRVVASAEISERFLWDMRQTAQELVIENHAGRIRELGHKNGLRLSIEPYDLNPCADLELGSVADVPQCEFWSKGYGYATEFSCIEAASLGHTLNHPVVAAEAFTAEPGEDWKLYPGNMKAQGDWALCCGINRFIFHRYQHQPWLDRWPGMTMGPYGVHWERTQTWWDLALGFHTYLARCQQTLRRGQAVADVLYLTPEGAPMVFRPPQSALQGEALPDRRGYNFDGCAPSVLLTQATVKNGLVTFPGGMSYRLLVLPKYDTMTPQMLAKIEALLKSGATVVGPPPVKSPSLVNYPRCDAELATIAGRLWSEGGLATDRHIGKGRLIWSSEMGPADPGTAVKPEIYPPYEVTARVLAQMGVPPDFESDGSVRYIHRRDGETEIYFVANREDKPQKVTCRFRVAGKQPEHWDPLTGENRALPDFDAGGGITSVPLEFAPHESAFIVFRAAGKPHPHAANFPKLEASLTLTSPWEVAFNPKWGGPEKITFTQLDDWSKRPEAGIKYYSGQAVYRNHFDLEPALQHAPGKRLYVSLGDVQNMAAVKINGKSLGIAWCAPWRLEIDPSVLKEKGNEIEITVANLWVNRLIGDQGLPKEKRLTWTTRNPFHANTQLLPSGLLGPVTFLTARDVRAD